MSTLQFDVLVIGSGIAGLSAALEIAISGKSVGIVTRAKKPEDCNSFWAQGGIIYSHENNDNPELLIKDIYEASAQTANVEAAKILAAESGRILKKVLLDTVKTDFEKNETGELLYTVEAAHSKNRIIYKGDLTGKVIELSLLNYLETNPNITFLCEHTVLDLITAHHHGKLFKQRYEPERIVGAYAFNQRSKEVFKIISKATILATGGISGLYLHNTNAEGTRGDGHAMAKRAGARVVNMEFVQFHPTTFYDNSSHRRFLISEALRGEGGILINSSGDAFMKNYHPKRELAPRDVVSRCIWEEMISGQDDCVYLDITHKDRDFLQERFPTIYNHCLSKRIDMAKDPIPVVPAAHYSCGGVRTDLKGKTNLQGLWAVGEVACTGLHGANRLASTSLLEGLTWGTIAAKDALENIDFFGFYDSNLIKDWESGTKDYDLALISQDWLTLKQTMWNYVGISRSRNRLKRARAMFMELSEEILRFYKHASLHDELIGLRNGVETAIMVLESSMRNPKSIGCFHLKDE